MLILYLVGLILIFYLLAKICDQYFVESLDVIAKKWKLSDDVAGATLMAIGSSAPEFFTALIALTKVGSEQVGAGTIVGSAIFNILVIVGMSSIVATAYLNWKPVIRDLLFYLISILILLWTFADGIITWQESLMYLVGYAGYVLILSRWSGWFPDEKQLNILEEDIEVFEKEEKRHERSKYFGKVLSLIDHMVAMTFSQKAQLNDSYWKVFFISIVWIAVLSWGLVEIAVLAAHDLGIPQVIIALTILAAGTSIPDLLSSLIVAKKGRGDMAVSNAVGSNVFDILIGLGFPWFLYVVVTGGSVTVGTENLFSSILLLFFTVVTLLFLLITQKFKMGFRSGYFLVGLYVLYVCYSIYGAYYPEAWTLGDLLAYGGQVLGVIQ
ncbi:sodium:proton exchanger [Candidatus Roizmanbacteria bacterium CG_4_10_14_0_2_um_filter_39_13]|uniref:Sodium:proton exchanger n=1 Tax=Candidatus Roizmanbacteria bacterium CG_4_10_14_0_2_um_filter_39_13 TaxID=1974825 RepID=A0A2M7TZN9_9BACT|nr:MAG: sodium:proton exchanger [Candidatus Roizmanbacteria bacterium CG_4_10_14_0_2_um_filter_39_13]